MFIEIIDEIAVFCMHCTVIIVVCIVTGKQLNLPTCFICRHAVTILCDYDCSVFFNVYARYNIIYRKKKQKQNNNILW